MNVTNLILRKLDIETCFYGITEKVCRGTLPYYTLYIEGMY